MSKKSKRILALLRDTRERARLLESLNGDMAPEGSPVAGNGQEMTILKEMESLEDEHEGYMQNLKGE